MRSAHPRPWRRGSDYSRPPRRALDRGQRHVWRRRVVAEVRAGNLPGKAVLTSEAMLACMGEDGTLCPSHAAIAGKAGVGERTVARHIDRMVELGLMRKHRRLVRLPWPEGGRGATRVQQTSNAYELLFPPGHVVLKARRVPLNTGCHNGDGESDRRISLEASPDRERALKAIEQIRLQRTASLMRDWVSQAARGSRGSGTTPTTDMVASRPCHGGPGRGRND
jgi:hypothetical protein